MPPGITLKRVKEGEGEGSGRVEVIDLRLCIWAYEAIHVGIYFWGQQDGAFLWLHLVIPSWQTPISH